MSDSFVPEADRLDQEREVGPEPLDDDEPTTQRGARRSPHRYPERRPIEAPEADLLDQAQPVEDDDDWR